MAQTWPVSLQLLLNDADFNLEFGETTIRSDMDVGPAKVRRRFTDGVDVFTASITVDKDQYADFETFYKTTLAGGTLTFDYDHPISGVTTEFRIKGVPKISPLGGVYFTIGFTWEAMP